MDFEHIYLTAEQREHLALYIYLSDRNTRSFNAYELAERFGVTYRVFRHRLTLVEEDLQLINSEARLIHAHNRIQAPNDISINRYRIALFRQSLPAQLLVTSLVAPHTVLESFLHEVGISRAGLYRQISTLRQFLSTHKTPIRYQPLMLKGPEAAVRQSYLNLLWPLADRQLPLLPDQRQAAVDLVDQLFTARFFPKDFAREELQFAAAVSLVRIQQGHTMKRPFHIAVMKTPAIPTNLPEPFASLDSETLTNEIQFLYLTQWRVPRFHTDDDPGLQQLIATAVRLSGPTWQLVQDVLKSLTERLPGIDPSITGDFVLAGNMLKVVEVATLYADTGFVDPVLPPSPMRAYYPRLQTALDNYFRRMPSMFAQFRPDAPVLTAALYQLLWPYMRHTDVAEQLHVSIDPQMSQAVFETIRINLLHLAFIRIVPVGSQTELLIASQQMRPNEQPQYEGVPIFYLAIERFESWSSLYHRLFKLASATNKRTSRPTGEGLY